MKPESRITKGKKTQSKRPRSTEEPKEISQEALEKLNKISQNFLEGIGLDLGSIKPIRNSSAKQDSPTPAQAEERAEEEEHRPEKRAKAPEVVVFTPVSATKTASKAEYKQFMSSKIKALDQAPKVVAPVSKKQEKEDKDNIKNDMELNDLLTNSRLIERLAASELTGKARRKHQYQQLNKLGCKSQKTKAHHNPTNVRYEMLTHKFRKHEESIEKAKEEGNYHKSLKHLFDADMPKKKTKSKDGLKTSMGKYQDGVLHISKAHIKRNTAAARENSKGKKGPHRR